MYLECDMGNEMCECLPSIPGNSNVIYSPHTVNRGNSLSWRMKRHRERVGKKLNTLEINRFKEKRYSLDVHLFLAAAANTYCILRNGKNCYVHRFDKYRIHHNDIDPCPRHQTDYKLNTWTAHRNKKKKENGSDSVFIQYVIFQAVWPKTEWFFFSVWFPQFLFLSFMCSPFRNVCHNLRIRLVPFVVYHNLCKLIPLGFFCRNDDPHFHRDSIDNWRIFHNTASKWEWNKEKKTQTLIWLDVMKKRNIWDFYTFVRAIWILQKFTTQSNTIQFKWKFFSQHI